MSGETAKLSFKERLHYLHRFFRYRNRTEPDTVRFIEEEVSRGDVVLDIGANKGIVTYFLGKAAGPEGRVLAFEPQPEMEEQIGKVAATFGLRNVEIFPIGLSDRDEETSLFRGEAGSTAVLEAGRDWQQDEITIEITTLDGFLEKQHVPRVDFIKCDVDGYELHVLNGARRLLGEQGPKVLIEISETALEEVTSVFRELGYDDGVFWYRGRRYPAGQTSELPYRHVGAEFRNFLFCKR